MEEKLGMARISTPQCIQCGQGGTVLVQMDDFLRYQAGALIQDAFPTLSADLREQLLTGTHPECWDKIFPPEEDEIQAARDEYDRETSSMTTDGRAGWQ